MTDQNQQASEAVGRVSPFILLKQGGAWLGAARSWIQRNCINGDSVTWGSMDELRPPLTVEHLEELAAFVAAEAMNESWNTRALTPKCDAEAVERIAADLANHIASMAPHQKERRAGQLLIKAHQALQSRDAETQRLKHAIAVEYLDVTQTLGKALGYPWFKNDQKNFPGATEKDGVCVGEHVAASIASEAARKITELNERVRELEEIRAVFQHGADEEHWKPGTSLAEAVASLSAELARVKKAIDCPKLTAGNARGIAYHVRQGSPFGGIQPDALADYLVAVAQQLEEFDRAIAEAKGEEK